MDDLTRIRGIGPATAKRLGAAGIDSLAALAGVWSDAPAFDGIANADIAGDWIATAKDMLSGGQPSAEAAESSNSQGKPPRPDDDDDGRAEATAVPADGGVGDPHSNTPRGSSGTARPRVEPLVSTRPEGPSSTGGGTTAETPGVGTQSGSPDLASDTPPSEMGGGDALNSGVSTVPPDTLSAMEDHQRSERIVLWPTSELRMRSEWPIDAPEARRGFPPLLEAMEPAELVSRYPRTAAAIEAWAARHEGELLSTLSVTIRIAARREGFRRCGMAHPKAATDHPADRFTPEELERLLSEPNLVVELV